jgi:hypothetical protein
MAKRQPPRAGECERCSWTITSLENYYRHLIEFHSFEPPRARRVAGLTVPVDVGPGTRADDPIGKLAATNGSVHGMNGHESPLSEGSSHPASRVDDAQGTERVAISAHDHVCPTCGTAVVCDWSQIAAIDEQGRMLRLYAGLWRARKLGHKPGPKPRFDDQALRAMVDGGGMTAIQVAEALGMPPSTVRSAIDRARAATGEPPKAPLTPERRTEIATQAATARWAQTRS